MTCRWCHRKLHKWLYKGRTLIYLDDDNIAICDKRTYTTDPILHLPNLHDIESLVNSLPKCDFTYRHPPCAVPDAAADGKTISGTWANMCEECFVLYGVGLGIGRGQLLILKKEN